MRDLRTWFDEDDLTAKAVDGVSFELNRGETLGIVGESGSGKSMTGLSIMGLIDPPGQQVGGRVVLNGQDLSHYTPEQWRQVRGQRIVMIFQDPMVTLNPVLRIDTQMVEAVQALADKEATGERHRVLAGLLAGIRRGESFSQSVAAFPEHFPPRENLSRTFR